MLILDPNRCETGEIFNPRDEESYSKGEQAFPDWVPALAVEGWGLEPGLEIVEHKRGKVLAWTMKHRQRCLLTKESEWRDFTVSAELSVSGPDAETNLDHPDCLHSRAGILFRLETVRHNYYLCIEGLSRLVLYRRADAEWAVLGEHSFQFEPDKYYHLWVKTRGNRTKAGCEEAGAFDVIDYAFPAGRIGFISNSPACLRKGAIEVTSGQAKHMNILREIRERRLSDLQDNFPKAVLWKTLDLREWKATTLRLARIRSEQKTDILLTCKRGKETWTVAVDIDGEIIWEKPWWGLGIPIFSPPGKNGEVFIYATISGTSDSEKYLAKHPQSRVMVKIDAGTGEILTQRTLPEGNYEFTQTPGVTCDLQGTGYPTDFILRDGSNDGTNIWAFNENLELLWQASDITNPKFGHNYSIGFFDVNGDKKEEVFG